MAHDRGPPAEGGEAVAKLIRILGRAIARRRIAATCRRREAAERASAGGAGPARDDAAHREKPATEAETDVRDGRGLTRDLAGDGRDLLTVDWNAAMRRRRGPAAT